MARKKPPTPAARGRPARYPWARWLAGRGFTARPDKDFTCNPRVFAIQANRNAALRGVRVTTTVDAGTGAVSVTVVSRMRGPDRAAK